MNVFRSVVTILLLAVVSSPGFNAAQTTPPAEAASPTPAPIERRDSGVQPTHQGSVLGQVYDAVTGAPVAGAVVTVQEQGEFREDARKPCLTDEAGRYTSQAGIGRVSQNLDIGRLLSARLRTTCPRTERSYAALTHGPASFVAWVSQAR